MSEGNLKTWTSLFSTAFISGTCAAAANFLANVTWQSQNRQLDWRDLALLTSAGAMLGVRYAKTGKPFFSYN